MLPRHSPHYAYASRGKNYDNMLSSFHVIPERYGQTDGRTDRQTDRIAISMSRVRVLTHDNKKLSCPREAARCFVFVCIVSFDIIPTAQFLSRVSILTRDIDTANLSVRLSVCPSVRPSVRNVPISDENGLTYRYSFFTIR